MRYSTYVIKVSLFPIYVSAVCKDQNVWWIRKILDVKEIISDCSLQVFFSFTVINVLSK